MLLLGLANLCTGAVTDFSRFSYPLAAEALEQMTLAECVEGFVNDADLQTCFERAALEVEKSANGSGPVLTELLSLSTDLIDKAECQLTT